jgi:hypothetical protein
VAPQIGTMIQINKDVIMNLKVSYNYVPFEYENFKNIQYIGLSLGFTIANFVVYE